MTTPPERTRSISGTRWFLESIVDGISDVDTRLVRTLAASLLKNFPLDQDILVSSDCLPSIWAPPLVKSVEIDVSPPTGSGLIREFTEDRGLSRFPR